MAPILILNCYFVCRFSRVVFVLDGQEGQDASFLEDNYLFFLSGSEQGKMLLSLWCLYRYGVLVDIIKLYCCYLIIMCR